MIRIVAVYSLLFSIFGGSIWAQGDVSPEVKYQQDLLKKTIADSGFSDAELDDLHAQIKSMLPSLDGMLEKDENGTKIRLPVSSGESYRLTGEHYIITGFADVYVTPANDVQKVVLTYERLNLVGNEYKMEKREMVNPTPASGGDKLDRNDDLLLNYYESTNPQEGFQKVGEISFANIDLYRNQSSMLRAYKQYLRKTVASLEKKITDVQRQKRARMLYMIEFE